MWFDIPYKIARKALPAAAYNWISYTLLRRRKVYERNTTYEAIFAKYLEACGDCRDKVIVEAGCGLQWVTALLFLKAGAREVHLVEPKAKNRETLLFDLLKHQKHVISGSDAADKVDVLERIHWHTDFQSVRDNIGSTADWIFSYTVLEHVGQLESFHKDSYHLLNGNGQAWHVVDLSDHTYQVFDRIPYCGKLNANRGLFHLRYSARAFARLNDVKCPMHRHSMPGHAALARRAGFQAETRVWTRSRNCVVHSDLHHEDADLGVEGDWDVLAFSMLLSKKEFS